MKRPFLFSGKILSWDFCKKPVSLGRKALPCRYGAQIKLAQGAEIIAAFVRMEAEGLELGGNGNPNSPKDLYKNVTKNGNMSRKSAS